MMMDGLLMAALALVLGYLQQEISGENIRAGGRQHAQPSLQWK